MTEKEIGDGGDFRYFAVSFDFFFANFDFVYLNNCCMVGCRVYFVPL